MMKKVLVVDDDREMLDAIQEGLGRYKDSFSVTTAENGARATERLEEDNFSLVVTDLKMPGMDGFGLLIHIMDKYPDIPVIIITGYGTPEMKRLAREGGAVNYITKPFLIENLARKINMTLSKESEGGSIRGISAGLFLQLIELEERTCTIRFTNRKSHQQGVLWFREGVLLDARLGTQQGIEAAYDILSWEDISLAIHNKCPKNDNNIEKELQAVILEAMRRQDETSPDEDRETNSKDDNIV